MHKCRPGCEECPRCWRCAILVALLILVFAVGIPAHNAEDDRREAEWVRQDRAFRAVVARAFSQLQDEPARCKESRG